MKSPIVKRSIMIAGRRTSITLEDAFWKGLKEIAAKHETSVQKVVAAVHSQHRGNLSSALRLFVLDYYWVDGCCCSREKDRGSDSTVGFKPGPE
jgi:predicted DNA-binding ribbon-helix-helix protein